MIEYERKIEYLNKNRVIYKRMPINDLPSEVYDWGYFYENGTYEYYNLFNSSAKITSFKSLKWHLLVIWHLNKDMSVDKFRSIAKFICNNKNGFTTFTISDSMFENLIREIMLVDLEDPPKNKIRKIIFKDYCGLEKHEKMSIVGQFIGKTKSITEEDIYECMLSIHDTKKKITVTAIAKMLGCSTRTIYRTISDTLQKEKTILNSQL